MIRPYETLILLSNELGDGQKTLLERLQQLIGQGGGVLDASHDWGNRRLAYTIGKQTDAHYFLLEYQADGPTVAEIERTLRITDGVLRYMSLQQEHTGLPQPRPREAREHVPLYEMRGPRGEGGRRGYDTDDREPRGEAPADERLADRETTESGE
jgi:small subunit ribosomal protein S6